MRRRSMRGVFAAFVVGVALCCAESSALAAADRDAAPADGGGATATTEADEPATYFETVGDYSLGYRWVSSEDSLKAAEYIDPHSSLAFGLNLLSCPLPYRYHLNSEFLGSHDFYTDAGFAYKDLVLYRDILVGTHQNLNHYNYQYAGEAGLLSADRNVGDIYAEDFVSNLSALRLKAPDFPFHTFVNQRHVEQNGVIQQRFLLGYFGNLNKTSESRASDWRSDALTLGANSHVGPVEIEYAHDLAKFGAEHNNTLYDTYPVAAARPSDIYPHAVVPETESSEDSVKLHSSYTGSMVTAATLSNLYEKNNYSLTQSNTSKEAFDFSWIPDPMVGLFFKYRHRNEAIDTPDAVTVSGLANTLNYSVREGVSYDKDVFSLSARYRPLKMLALFSTYEFSHIQREDIAEWAVLPEQTNVHTINFTAQATPADMFKVKGGYEYKNYSDPAYNDTPDHSNKLRLTSTYTPTPSMNVDLEYILTVTERNGLRYLNNNPAVLLEIGERSGRSDQFLASLSTELSALTSLTASWFYQRWDVAQDLTYGKRSLITSQGDIPYIDIGVPYTDESNSFSLSFCYIPQKDITVTTGVTYVITEGNTGYNDVVGGAPFSLAAFSDLKASETIFTLDLTKRLSKEWEVGLRSHLGVFNDRTSGLLDGNIFTSLCNFKRYF